MTRLATIFAAALFVAAPVAAGTYSAKPTAAPAAKRIVGKDVVWACGSEGCRGATDYGRPQLLCQNLAKKAGTLESFLADGRAFDAAELAKCNIAARTSGGSAAVSNAN